MHQGDDDESSPRNDSSSAAATDGGDGYSGSAGYGIEDNEESGFHGSEIVIVILRSEGRVDLTG